MVLIGYYSLKQAIIVGYATYITPDGKIVEVTEVVTDGTKLSDKLSDRWDDLEYVGTISKLIESKKKLPWSTKSKI